MSVIEEKIRRRLAPFVVEGKIATPQFSSGHEPSESAVTVNIRLRSPRARADDVETALYAAIHDLGGQAQLVITGA